MQGRQPIGSLVLMLADAAGVVVTWQEDVPHSNRGQARHLCERSQASLHIDDIIHRAPLDSDVTCPPETNLGHP